jgi:hypothetical protein
VISGGTASTLALVGSTEEAQFEDVEDEDGSDEEGEEVEATA